ncbi:MAG: AAA family ATPase [Methanobrevibacter sp.]|nr:AAA family ATPase [Methanobrevibacter sp.]
MANMWMVRAGENAFLIDDFKKLGVVAIGWEIGDLSGKNSNEIKQIMAKKYSNFSKTRLGLNSGQVTRFACDFEIDDWVISYNPHTRNYLIGKITSDYYYSEKLAEKYNQPIEFYHHFRNVDWLGETNRDDLSGTSLKPLKSVMTIFNLNNAAKNELITKMDYDKIEWTDFYMEFADRLLDFKNNRSELINKIENVFKDLGMVLPTLERNSEGNDVIPKDIDPFTVFALFNKQISTENRIKIINQIKKEFLIENDAPNTFHGISLVNNLKATFYFFSDSRGKNDLDNLWKLYEIALNYSDNLHDEFVNVFDIVLNQQGIKWNITMGLNWIRPFTFINLDQNNRNILTNDEIFSEEFRNEIKSLKAPPKGEDYLHICKECKRAINNSSKYSNFPELSHGAYITKTEGNDPEGGMGDGDVRQIHYWLISPGQNAYLWDEFYNNNEMGIGFDGTGDLIQYDTKEEIKLKFQEMYDDNASHKNDVNACWQFLKDMQIGDVVFAKKGMGEIIGRGIIQSGYEYNTNKNYHKIRKVNWTHRGNWTYEHGKLPMKTLTDITLYQEMVDNIKELFIEDGDVEDIPIYPDYGVEKFLDEVYIDQEDYYNLINLLKNKKNLIVEGAPGVGKTFMAKRLAYSIMGVKDIERVMMVQFHQSYSYEDFVMGYRPYENGFKLKHGSFYKFCKKAEEDSENDYFFIIDEINRGNISKIFGELFMLIESDKRGEKNKIQLLYSDELFFIPKNVYIIGLMNTADRSLAMIDYALRRRFAFFNLKPGFNSEGFKNYQNELSNDIFDNVIQVIGELNNEINNDDSLGEGFRIGHSYLCNFKEDVEEKLIYVVEYELIPLLKEYWFDEIDKVEFWSSQLRSVIYDSF